MDQDDIKFYSDNAEIFSKQYDALDFKAVHHSWLSMLPDDGVVLDIGAGSGRDARFLAEKGLKVVAVEPSKALLNIARNNSLPFNIHWINDQLPELSKVFSLHIKFDLILLSAVWMHIPLSNRERAFRKISNLLKPGGKAIFTLRYGNFSDGRSAYETSVAELSQYARKFGLLFEVLTEQKQQDQLGRQDVSWDTVAFTFPDDGKGSFPLIRNIIVNDSKSSTYKIALLRSLLRIAEGHPGAVCDQDDDYVVLPLGLVALYWLKLYKPLLDTYGMQQSNNGRIGLGFVKPEGWGQLTDMSLMDISIGAVFTQEEKADYLFQALKDISRTIRDMPVKHISLPNSKERVFFVDLQRQSRPDDTICLDMAFFQSFGSFYVPRAIWDSLFRYSIWIEPVLINEWASIMSSYKLNKEKKFNKLCYLSALQWDDPVHKTDQVRKRFKELAVDNDMLCCWSAKKLIEKEMAVDHTFPFARWPNNDLWNLLPVKDKINFQKSDRLPTNKKLTDSKEEIIHWWEQAWDKERREFFTQANLALPSLSSQNDSFDDVFQAVLLQRDRIKDFQQLQDWE
ncbi:methyltransferase domain-containing protein [Oceanospirillum sediminis]|uniref:Methyltransferase domain-containing protein n=1 Tax=Oceanospirillum sediminis TaxID=2760088 RepID=A0A839IXC9_9GAMM|nr:class I SAM-dependent methyltransferase [Oceanospirillum sediminis]MBB1488746.1 methyltransferase domain-containing protein [Oceanospirillum sediminis]